MIAAPAARICVPIVARDQAEAIGKMKESSRLADLFEIRLDLMNSFDLYEIVRASPRPTLITYRSRKQGGKGGARYGTRVGYLLKAFEAGAAFVDVEHGLPLEYRQEIFQNGDPSRIILSAHLPNGTPSSPFLEDRLRKMVAQGAAVVKLVTRAREVEDNLRVLQLIPLARRLGVRIIAFCMGPLGKISRVASPLLGGFLTFASLGRGEESADGQLSALEMRTLLDYLGAV